MITHYDMHTGEVIERSDRDTRADQRPGMRPTEQLRLMSVQEAAVIEQRIAAAAPAVIMLPVDLLLGR